MYIKTTRKIYKGKEYKNYLLVESVHTPNGPRQKVICSLGDLRARPAGDWLQLVHKVEDTLVGQKNLFTSADPEVEKIVKRVRRRQQEETKEQKNGAQAGAAVGEIISVCTEGVRTEEHRQAGVLHVGVEFWRRLGLNEILSGVGFDERARTLTCAMVMNRLIAPKSEHAMPEWFQSTAVGDILGEEVSALTDDALYRHLDRLHPQRSRIEAELAERERNLFNLDETIYLYALPLILRVPAGQTPRQSAGIRGTSARIACRCWWGWSSIETGFRRPTRYLRATDRIARPSMRCLICSISG